MANDQPGLEDSAGTRIVARFLSGPVAVLMIVGSLLAGAISLAITPREEEPQIIVPLADVLVHAPGLSAEKVERQVATRLEKLLYQIDGVEYVYSMSMRERCVVTVRFYVGEDREESLVKIYSKLHSHVDRVTADIASWVVKPIEIDDVPIVIATLWSRDPERYGPYELQRIGKELEQELQAVENTNRIAAVGGTPRVVRVLFEPEALAARRTTPLDLAYALRVSSLQRSAGTVEAGDESQLVEVGTLIGSVRDLENLVVNVVDGLPVYLRDVAKVVDGPDEATHYTWIGFGPASEVRQSALRPAVHLAVAKKKGTNAVWVARDAIRRLEELKGRVIPPGVEIEITRDHGATAKEKVDELVEALAVGVLTVVIFIGMVLGWRAAIVIALAIPVCYGATLLINYLAGYTINRVTLFALILALGLLVDDPITGVENIERYFRRGKYKPRNALLRAVAEVRGALVMSTVAIILSFVPLFFITGMMGPYMAPMAMNVPLAVTMSTVVAFCVTPFVAFRVLRKGSKDQKPESDDAVTGTFRYRFYDRMLRPLLQRRGLAWIFLGGVGVLFVLALLLPAFRMVPLKMLPFDNKNEFQVLVNMPEGTPVERTDGVLRDLGAYLLEVPEVESVAVYSGIGSPMDFNGMVRHYYLRNDPHTGDLRVQLVHKSRREHQSHEIVLRVRRDLERIGERGGAVVQIVEVPPGPPVLSTITTEIYGDEDVPYSRLEEAAQVVAERMRREPFVTDVDTSVEAPQRQLTFVTDKEKAALSGVSTEDVVNTVGMALQGRRVARLDAPTEVDPLEIILRMDRARRTDPATLRTLQVKGQPGILKEREGGAVKDLPQPLVGLGELGRVEESTRTSTIYHKNLKRVAFVFAELAGRPPADAILDMTADEVDAGSPAPPASPRPLEGRTFFELGSGEPWSLPEGTRAVWNGEGEWQITLDVFRDLGIAFGAANIAIFFVLWLQTGSVIITLTLMAAIPLTMIGIMPGFWALNLVGERVIDGFSNATFFTATAMIGMIALSGIVVRNSLVLVDFVHMALRKGLPLEEALVRSGAIRVRPILLTAGTTFLGNIVITLDPVFSGLAWAIIFGIFASTVFSLGVVPVIYNLVYATRPGHGLPAKEET
ncbi:MAG: efflux RND transporter permease subunit [Planctomycetota bacterium]|jgi:multidrug efflux pump subunit AcrB